MSPLPHLTDEDFEATLKRAFCTTAPQMLEIEPDPVAPGEPVFAPAAGTALRPPDSPPAWLTGYCWDNLEDLEGALADVTGAARELRWQQADMCAGAWLSAPDAKARQALLRRLGAVLMCSARTAERRVLLGLTYPPDLRAPDVSQRVYLAALKAADPCSVVRAALRYGWSARQVIEHIDTGQAPTERVTALDAAYPYRADPEEIADAVYRAVCEELARAGERAPLEIHARIIFIYPAGQEAA